MNKTHLEDILSALNVSALERLPNGAFVPMGEPPEWLHQFSIALGEKKHGSDSDAHFCFLENFLIEATQFWEGKKKGCLRSGIWIEGNKSGKKFMFEAIAITSTKKHILIITRDHQIHTEKQSFLQKGRELALNYQTLEKLEKGLQKARAELESRVKQRTNELEVSNKRIAEELRERKRLEEKSSRMQRQLLEAQKMEAIGTLAGGIAHDFNNILSAIVGYTEISMIQSGTNEPLKDNLEKILGASFRARDLVKQILAFSCQAKEELKPVRIRPIIAEVIDLIRASLPPGVEIRSQFRSDRSVFADPTQIHQVVMNLCTNAIQAMENSGGILTVSLKSITIRPKQVGEITGLHGGPHIQLSVQDTGCGITAENITQIFNPFFTTRKVEKGTGLGLSVVHGIIKSCRGAITVDTTPGEGTTFHAYIPEYTAPTIQKTIVTQMPPKGSERILFVDDDPVQTELAVKRLGTFGYDIITFTDSTQALLFFAEQPQRVDIVITDLLMPKLSGEMLAEEMLRIRPDIPIILCSGYSELISEESARAMGIRDYLMKPIAIGDLARSIRISLDA
jgi:signal transduction histidine kinase/CheY-like chemotaxis protein